MKKLRTFIAILLFILFIGLVACDDLRTPTKKTTDEEVINQAYEMVISLISTEVKEDVYLITEYKEVSVSFVSSDPNSLYIDGDKAIYNKPAEDTFVILTITLNYKEKVVEKNYTVLVSKYQGTIDLLGDRRQAILKCDEAYNAIDEELIDEESYTAITDLYDSAIENINSAKSKEEIASFLDEFLDKLFEICSDIEIYQNKGYQLIDEYLELYIDACTSSEEEALLSLKTEYYELIANCNLFTKIFDLIDEFYVKADNILIERKISVYRDDVKEEINEYFNRQDYSKLTDDDKALFDNLLSSIMNDLNDSHSYEKIDEVKSDFYYEFTRLADLLLNDDTIDIDDIELSSYYSDINLTYRGNNMLLSLRTLITSTHKYKTTYNDLKTMTIRTDTDPNNSRNIILIYSRMSVRGTWDSGTTWNREHVWPQSKGWFTTSGAGSDIHHLRPEDPSVNTSRGNKAFGSQTNSGFYCPQDCAKGDVARIIFYLLVRYPESDNYPITNVAQSMDLLLKWNELDPVDDLERHRNEEAYKIQGNRNPFIDYAGFASIIWGKVKISFDDLTNEFNVLITITYCDIVEINKNYYKL